MADGSTSNSYLTNVDKSRSFEFPDTDAPGTRKLKEGITIAVALQLDLLTITVAIHLNLGGATTFLFFVIFGTPRRGGSWRLLLDLLSLSLFKRHGSRFLLIQSE
jgi:hypothetical protein